MNFIVLGEQMIIDSPLKGGTEVAGGGGIPPVTTIKVFDAKENLGTLRKMLQDVSTLIMF